MLPGVALPFYRLGDWSSPSSIMISFFAVLRSFDPTLYVTEIWLSRYSALISSCSIAKKPSSYKSSRVISPPAESSSDSVVKITLLFVMSLGVNS